MNMNPCAQRLSKLQTALTCLLWLSSFLVVVVFSLHIYRDVSGIAETVRANQRSTAIEECFRKI